MSLKDGLKIKIGPLCQTQDIFNVYLHNTFYCQKMSGKASKTIKTVKKSYRPDLTKMEYLQIGLLLNLQNRLKLLKKLK